MPFTQSEKDYFNNIASVYWVDYDSLDQTIDDDNSVVTSLR